MAEVVVDNSTKWSSCSVAQWSYPTSANKIVAIFEASKVHHSFPLIKVLVISCRTVYNLNCPLVEILLPFKRRGKPLVVVFVGADLCTAPHRICASGARTRAPRASVLPKANQLIWLRAKDGDPS